MTTSMRKKEMFFENEDNAKVISSFIRKAESAHIGHDGMATRLRLSKEIIEYIEEFPNEWDEKCQFNIEYVGDKFLDHLRNFTQESQENINNIYILSYRFLCEIDFFTVKPQLDMKLGDIKNKIQNDNAETGFDIRPFIHYATYIMPINMLKGFISDPNIVSFQEFEQTKIEAEDLKKKWDKELQTLKTEVEVLKENLDTYKTGLNFVGLNKGFLNLAHKKAKEESLLFRSLIGMGVLLIVMPYTLLVMWVDHDKNIGIDGLIKILPTIPIQMIPIISIEIILIYFFRIILLNHRSVKAQIMQLELRLALCQFIQSYTDYSSKIKANDKKALEKFENLIFSGILSNPEKLPSTFDGIEQISEFIKNIKSK